MRLEVIVLPVTDVERAKGVVELAGFQLEVDHRPSDEFRVG
jgi:hypothetical protein